MPQRRTDALQQPTYAPHLRAEVIYLGAIGTRQYDIDQLIRQLQSKVKSLSSSMKLARVDIGSSAISRKKVMSAGSWPHR